MGVLDKNVYDMKSVLFWIILLFTPVTMIAQKMAKEEPLPNLVPNPGFELFSTVPLGWYFKAEHFNTTTKYWTSPTGTSPDVYSPKVRIPENWAEKGFGKLKAHSGNAMVGITVFGCENGKPHCREYVQIQLLEALVPNQMYSIEFYYNHLSRSIQINNIGVTFSKKKINTKIEDPLTLNAIVAEKEIMSAGTAWKKFAKRFKATEASDYLILGNFSTDKLTSTRMSTKSDALNFAYYYIDDIVLKKIPPILTVAIPNDDLTKVKIEKGKIIQLKNIYFASDDFELEPRSFVELKKLLFLLRENPTMTIEVRGHTDNQGTHDYNMKLSQGRAESVMNFLSYNGIKPYRLKAKGFGETQPLTTNDNEDARQENRRVEFAILTQ
jgi:OmpA-OmpF porin, OOP family